MSLFEGLNLDKNVGDFKNKVNSAMSGIKERGLAPVDSTLTKMEEGVALVNNRDKLIGKVINEHRSEVVEQLSGVINALDSGIKLNLNNAAELVKLSVDGFELDQNALIESASKSMGINLNSTKDVIKRVAANASERFQDLTGGKLGGIINKAGDAVRIVGDWRNELGSETLKQIAKITGIDDLLDISARAAVLGSVFDNATKYGISDKFEEIYNSYPPGFEDARRLTVIELIGNALREGDLISVSSLVALLDQESLNVVRSTHPNLVQFLMTKFKFDNDINPSDKDELLTSLQSLLNNLIGENWFERDTEFGTAFNLGMFNSVSSDMKELLSGWDEILPLVTTIGMFKEEPAVDILNKDFKHVAQFDLR